MSISNDTCYHTKIYVRFHLVLQVVQVLTNFCQQNMIMIRQYYFISNSLCKMCGKDQGCSLVHDSDLGKGAGSLWSWREPKHCCCCYCCPLGVWAACWVTGGGLWVCGPLRLIAVRRSGTSRATWWPLSLESSLQSSLVYVGSKHSKYSFHSYLQVKKVVQEKKERRMKVII